MKILAIDTATEACSVALDADGAVVSRYADAGRDHTAMVMPMIDEVLSAGGLAVAELDALVFGRGPGSFTGVRIATSVVQGMATAADVGVVGVSTLAALAQRAHREHGAADVLACLDARMGEIYWGHFRIGQGGAMQPVAPEALTRADQAQLPDAAVAVGRGFSAYPALAAKFAHISDRLLPCATDMLVLARRHIGRFGTVSAAQAIPVYLRDEVAWKKPRSGPVS